MTVVLCEKAIHFNFFSIKKTTSTEKKIEIRESLRSVFRLCCWISVACGGIAVHDKCNYYRQKHTSVSDASVLDVVKKLNFFSHNFSPVRSHVFCGFVIPEAITQHDAQSVCVCTNFRLLIFFIFERFSLFLFLSFAFSLMINSV